MDIVKVFGDNLRKYRNGLGLSQEHLLTNAVCTEHISVLLNVIAGALLLKMFNVLLMLLGSKHINYLSKARNKNDLYT